MADPPMSVLDSASVQAQIVAFEADLAAASSARDAQAVRDQIPRPEEQRRRFVDAADRLPPRPTRSRRSAGSPTT